VALTDEQRAMVQLLLEGGQGYDDIGSLLGIRAEEVRSRAREALTEIGGADPDAQVGLSDYLLGQADPIGRADAIRHLQSDPEANALAERLVQNLRLLAPKAQLPEIPEPRGGRRAAAAAPSPDPAAPVPPAAPAAPPPQPVQPRGPGLASRVSGFFSGLSRLSGKRRTQFLVAMVAVLGLVIAVVAVASGGGGGGNGDCKPLNTAAAQQAGVPSMKLAATGAAADADCAPSGQITLGSVPQSQQSKNQVPSFVLQANAVNLPATGTNERYLLWLYKSDDQSIPLDEASVDSSGNLTRSLQVPAPELLLIPAFQTVRLAKVTTAESQQVQQSLQAQRKKNPTLLTHFVGEPVLEGNVSELGLAQLLQQAQAQSQGATGQGQQQGGTKG
jgi:hypothetical protein